MSKEQLGTSGYTTDELASLTPDELSALETENGDEDILGELAADDVVVADDTADKVEPPEGEPAAVAAETVIDDPAEVLRPIYEVATPENTDAARADLSLKKAEALQKLLDGELTAAEYSTIDNEVQAQLNAMHEASIKAQVSQEMTQQQQLREWDKEVSGIVKVAKAEGLDYSGKPELMDEFDTLIRVFSNEAMQKGMSDVGLAASKWALTQAHSIMKVRHGIVAKSANESVNEPAKPAGPRHNLQTLSGLPNADRANVDNDTISRMGTFEGEDLEKAMASMSAKEIEKLMASV